MPKVKVIQTNMTSGVVDPLLIAREDSTFYYNALADGRNLLILPQGGGRRRPGLQFIRTGKRKLAAVSYTGSTITAPNGGTVANIQDNDFATALTTTNDLASTNPFVVARVDFSAPVTVCLVDVIDYFLSAGALDDEFVVQHSQNDAAWVNYGAAFNWDAAKRSRRISGGTVTARYWRVVRIGSTNLAAKASITELKFWNQESALSQNVRLAPFAYSTDEAYMMACSDQNIDVLNGDDLCASIAIPHTETHLPVMNWSQSLDTMILYHGQVRTQRIFRQGGDDEFDFRDCEFENIPEVDLGAGVGGADEVQILNQAGAAGGNQFTLLLDGERTASITIVSTTAAQAIDIQTKLRDLPNTSADGIIVTANGASHADGYTVTFGGDDGKRPWSEIKVSVLSGNGVWDTARKVKGRPPGEPIMSDARGWPRCGTIHQQRHIMGGFPAVPNAFMASFLSEFYNFDTEIDDPSKGLLFRPDTDQVGAVHQIVGGRHLSIFTNDGEFYIPTEPLSESAAAKLTTRSGIKEGLRVHESDGALLFVQGVKDDRSDREIGTSIREFLFVDTEQSYMANPTSKLSSHLIKNPVDNAMRKAVNTDESDILLLVNEDGTGVAYTVLRNELVNAFMPITLRDQDKMRAVGVDKKRRVYFINERIINGQAVQYIERWNENLLLDCGDIITIPAEVMTATPGQTVFTWSFTSPATVAEIGLRIDGARLDGYAVDLVAKTITIDAGLVGGEKIRISKMIQTVTGIDHLEGETIQTYIDGSPGDEYVVSGGSITLNAYADTEIQYGFGIDVYGKLMPFRIPGQQTLAGDKMRVVRAILSLYKTGDLEIRVNGGQWRNVRMIKMDNNILDQSLDAMLFSGEADMRGLMGWAEGGILEFRQTPQRPAPLTIRAITREVAF